MKETEIKVKRFDIKYGDFKCNIFVAPSKEFQGEFSTEDDKPFMEFWIKGAHHGFMDFCIGANLDELDCSVEDFIIFHIGEWVEDYLSELEVLESE